MTVAHFAIPGDINTASGGYAYDRQVLDLLPASAVDVRHLQLPGGFPFPSESALAATARLLAAIPAGEVLLIDGLAHGVLPDAILAGIKATMVVLHHHPLGLETGLSEAESHRLLATEKGAFAFARHVIVTSSTTAATLHELGFAPPPTVTAVIPGTPARPRANGSHAKPPFRILSVGSIVPRKGYDILVDALARLPRGAWQSTIAGSLDFDPDCVAALREQIARAGLDEHITLVGVLLGDRLDIQYAQADIYCLPSRYEGYGMAFASALASGLPIVAARAGAVSETVPPQAGILVPVDDAAAVATALAQLMTDDALRQRLSDAAWAYGQTLPRWDDTAAAIAKVLHAVAKGTQS